MAPAGRPIIFACKLCMCHKPSLNNYAISGYTVPNTCVATSCRVEPPLDESQLSPNLLLILIHASAERTKLREAIRLTWIKDIINSDELPVQYRYILTNPWGNTLFPVYAYNGHACIVTFVCFTFMTCCKHMSSVNVEISQLLLCS